MKSLNKYRGLLLAFVVVVAFALIVKLRQNVMTSAPTGADTSGLSAPASAGQDAVTVYVQPASSAAPSSSVPGHKGILPPAGPGPFHPWSSSLSGLRRTVGAQFQRGLQFGPRPGGVISPAPVPGKGSAAAGVAPLSASSQTATDAANGQASSGDPFGAFLAELKIAGLPISPN